ncbi:class I SAM-dependent RNA methyltransferase [candidate division WOR-3 bacterium]|nr:class I SAM-dependent RNA methyltransferase [candidate division WOR-3 bacterium]
MDEKKLRIEKVVYGGMGLARLDGKVHLVPFTAPGDTVLADCREKKDYSICTVKSIIEPSPVRRKPICPHYTVCGGCHLQHLNEEAEIEIKEEFIQETLERIGGIKIQLKEFISGKFQHYRNKLEYSTFKGRPAYNGIDNRPFLMKECFIEDKNIMRVRKNIQGLRGVRKLILRTDDTKRVFAILKGNFNQRKNRRILNEAGVYYSISPDKKWNREEFLEFKTGGLNLVVSPLSFFQVNKEILERVIELLPELLSPDKKDIVVDAYSGVGTFGLSVSRYVKEVRLIEESKFGSDDSMHNIRRNYIENIKVFRGKVEENLDAFNGATKVVLDPPREGLNKNVIVALNEIKPERIVYISCNPSTLARDIKLLDGFKVAEVYGFNMFPYSYHVESIAILERG